MWHTHECVARTATVHEPDPPGKHHPFVGGRWRERGEGGGGVSCIDVQVRMKI